MTYRDTTFCHSDCVQKECHRHEVHTKNCPDWMPVSWADFSTSCEYYNPVSEPPSPSGCMETPTVHLKRCVCGSHQPPWFEIETGYGPGTNEPDLLRYVECGSCLRRTRGFLDSEDAVRAWDNGEVQTTTSTSHTTEKVKKDATED